MPPLQVGLCFEEEKVLSWMRYATADCIRSALRCGVYRPRQLLDVGTSEREMGLRPRLGGTQAGSWTEVRGALQIVALGPRRDRGNAPPAEKMDSLTAKLENGIGWFPNSDSKHLAASFCRANSRPPRGPVREWVSARSPEVFD